MQKAAYCNAKGGILQHKRLDFMMKSTSKNNRKALKSHRFSYKTSYKNARNQA